MARISSTVMIPPAKSFNNWIFFSSHGGPSDSRSEKVLRIHNVS